MVPTTSDAGPDTAPPPDANSATRPAAPPLALELTAVSKVYDRGKGTMVRAKIDGGERGRRVTALDRIGRSDEEKRSDAG